MFPVKKLFNWFRSEKSDETPQPWDDFWYGAIAALAEAGVAISPEKAMKVSAIWACNKVISETVAVLPWLVYKNLPSGGKQRAKDHPLYRLLHVAPNQVQTSLEFREHMQMHLNLYGKAFSLIERDYYGDIKSLSIPIHPYHVKTELLTTGVLRYQINLPGQLQKTVLQDNMLHLRGTTLNGYDGISPIEAGSDSIGLARAAEIFGSKFFANSARPSGVIMHPETLTQPAQERLRESVQKQGKHGVLVLEEGSKWEQMTVNAEDAQFLQTRQHQIEEVCRWYRMPPHKIAHLLRSTFSNIEHQSLEFVSDCIIPQVKRWEQRIAITLFEDEEYFSEMLIEGLLRGDTATRISAYTQMINSGQLSANEARILENRNPYPGGDDYYVPLNMAKVGDEPAKPPVSQQDSNKEDAQQDKTDIVSNFARDISERLANAQQRGLEKAGSDEQKLKAFYEKHHAYVAKSLEPLGIEIAPETITQVSVESVDEHVELIYDLIMENLHETVN